MDPKELIKKYQMCSEVRVAIKDEPKFAFDLLAGALQGLQEFREETNRRNSNIWLIVKNLKPEYLEEMKKLVIPEVFTSLGIDVANITQ